MLKLLTKLKSKKPATIIILLVSGIFAISLSFILTSCGSGPYIKVLVEKGAFALHLPMTSPACEDGSTAHSLVTVDASKILPLITNSNFTIEAWVKTSSTAANNTDKGIIFSIGGGDGGGFALYLWKQTAGKSTTPPKQCPSDAPSDRCVKFLVYDYTNGGFIAVANNDIVDGTWHHVAAVVNGTTMTVYIDGAVGTQSAADSANYPNPNASATQISDVRGTLGANIGSSLSGFYVGSGIAGWELGPGAKQAEGATNPTAATYIFSNGDFTIDEVRLWSEARTSTQIQTWMTKEINMTNWNQADPNNALNGYWRLNEGAGSTVIDASGQGNAGSKLRCANPGPSPTGCTILPKCSGGWVTGYPL